MAGNGHLLLRPPNLLDLPLELLLKISEYLSFADLWYLATSSRQSKAVAHQIISNRYHIDLSRPQLNTFNHIVHAALAYISRHGYKDNAIDHIVIQSVSNRLAVEIYDRSPLRNWEPCLDFFLDKTLGIVLDHVLLDPLLDTVPRHTTVSDLRFSKKRKAPGTIPDNANTNLSNQYLFPSEFYPTRMGKLMTTFLTTLYPTLIALFETEPTTEMHHRLLLNHINRHLENLSSRYHIHHRRRLALNASPRSTRDKALTAVIQHNQYLKLNFLVLIRFIGTLVQTDLLSMNDLNMFIREHIQFFFLTFQQVVRTNEDAQVDDQQPLKKKVKYQRKPIPSIQQLKQQQQIHHIMIYDSLKNKNNICWQMWLEEIEFQMEVFLDLTVAVLFLQKQDQMEPGTEDFNTVSTMLDDTVSVFVSTQHNASSNQQVPVIITSSSTTTATSAK
ncbi:unnamed protein product [Mucor hiemalis]